MKDKLNLEISEKEIEIANLNKQNSELKKELEEITSKYNKIINSKRWQKLNSILKFIGK